MARSLNDMPVVAPKFQVLKAGKGSKKYGLMAMDEGNLVILTVAKE